MEKIFFFQVEKKTDICLCFKFIRCYSTRSNNKYTSRSNHSFLIAELEMVKSLVPDGIYLPWRSKNEIYKASRQQCNLFCKELIWFSSPRKILENTIEGTDFIPGQVKEWVIKGRFAEYLNLRILVVSPPFTCGEVLCLWPSPHS